MKQYEPFYWANDLSNTFLSRGYLSPGETTHSRVRDVSNTAEKILNIKGFANKFYDYMSRGWYSLSSPEWSNYGKSRGLPVSCFNSHIDDNIGSILKSQGEIGMMSKLGGGTSGYFGELRHRGADITDNGKSTGIVHLLELFQTTTDVISQGSQRRGRMAAYLPITHPDILEFLDIGSDGHSIQDMNTGVVIDNAFMEAMLAGDKQKQELWGKLLKRRKEVGYPYIMFRTNANNQAPDVYKDNNYIINSSNLCNEIYLPSDAENSFTCVLASMNLLHYDEWKNTDAVETLIFFLDSVVTEFLTKLEFFKNSPSKEHNLVWEYMERSYNFTKNHRALGMGVLGLHSLFQSKMLSFESRDAAKLNLEIFKLLKEQSYEASAKLAVMYGEPPLLKGYGRRNTTTMAIAPTTSSAFILGQVSQSIEPLFSNYYIKDLAKIKTLIKNKFLEELLEAKGYNTQKVRDTILNSDGSVLDLPNHILDEEEKSVFLTFGEINQQTIIDQAAARQPYIDQGQSLNLMIPSNYTAKEISQLHIRAWQLGLKGLYYQHGTSAAQALMRSKSTACIACEG
jgi:ribonucleoside-diphosphate reductase alpha chain